MIRLWISIGAVSSSNTESEIRHSQNWSHALIRHTNPARVRGKSSRENRFAAVSGRKGEGSGLVKQQFQGPVVQFSNRRNVLQCCLAIPQPMARR